METKKNTVSISHALEQFRSEAIAEKRRRKAESFAARQKLRVYRAAEFRKLFEATFGTPLPDDVSIYYVNANDSDNDEDSDSYLPNDIPFVELSDLLIDSRHPVYVLYVPKSPVSPATLRYAIACPRCNWKFAIRSELIYVGPDWNPAVILDEFLAKKPTRCGVCVRERGEAIPTQSPATSSQRLLDALNAYLDERYSPEDV